MRQNLGDDSRENTDRWLLTYADMITLLMAFFIMMYSMSILNLAKFKEAAVSIRSGFGGDVAGHSPGVLSTGRPPHSQPLPNGQTGIRTSVAVPDESAAWKAIRPLVSYIQNTGGKENQKMRVYQDQRGIVIAMNSDELLFEPGSAKIKGDAYPILNRIAETLYKLEGPVIVEGHTCSIPPVGANYRSNWELSTARATNVIRYLVHKGIEPQRLAASGYASFRPLAPNTTAAGRIRNRRVEIVLPGGPRFAIGKPATVNQVQGQGSSLVDENGKQ